MRKAGFSMRRVLRGGFAEDCWSRSLLYTASPSCGQAVYGSLFGTVSDSSGAAVVNARVTVSDISRNTSYTTFTIESGHHEQIHLIAGRIEYAWRQPAFMDMSTRMSW